MAIVFYYAPYSSAVRCHWALEELGIQYEGVKIDLKGTDHKKPEFLKLNPNGSVPTLVDDGVPYFESAAINLHLGQKYGVEKGLWPAMGSAANGLATSWLIWSGVTLLNAATRLMLNSSPEFPEEAKNAKQAERARGDVHKLLGLLDASLADKPYLAGESFTLVDAHIAADLWWYQMGIVPDLSAWPNLKAWFGRCSERPAFKKIAGG